jgi:hypothetical protein
MYLYVYSPVPLYSVPSINFLAVGWVRVLAGGPVGEALEGVDLAGDGLGSQPLQYLILELWQPSGGVKPNIGSIINHLVTEATMLC